MMNILVVDDDPLVCTSLKTIIETDTSLRVCGIGNNADQAVSLYRRYQPDILLIDIRLGEKTGIDAAKCLFSEFPGARILFLTTFSDDAYIVEALQIGAKGYILKQNFESIVPSLKAVGSGQRVFGDEVMNKIPSLIEKNKKPNLKFFDLTAREAAVLALVADGCSNREIAGRLFLSEGTVRNYISTILEKLNLRDRTQLAVFYYKHC